MSSAGLADLLACVAAFARPLDREFGPNRFLSEFSAQAQTLVLRWCGIDWGGGGPCPPYVAYLTGRLAEPARQRATISRVGNRLQARMSSTGLARVIAGALGVTGIALIVRTL